jgi:hypothetical protein
MPHTAIWDTNISEECTTSIYKVASRWRQYFAPKCWYASTGLHAAITQKTIT